MSIELNVQGLARDFFEPTDLTASVLTPQLKARAGGFLVLAHAEIESGIEEACYQTSGLIGNYDVPLIAMLAWGVFQGKSKTRLAMGESNLKQITKKYDKSVVSNNGIKKKDMCELLVPLGVAVTLLSTDLLVLEDFGQKRGDLAHKGLSVWNTKDLPSAHVSRAIQAARSADAVVVAIRSKHSSINAVAPAGRVRRSIARACRRAAELVEGI